jgi:hypothetical protein
MASNINMGGTYNVVQTVFALSLLSNSANGISYGLVNCRFLGSVRYLDLRRSLRATSPRV